MSGKLTVILVRFDRQNVPHVPTAVGNINSDATGFKITSQILNPKLIQCVSLRSLQSIFATVAPQTIMLPHELQNIVPEPTPAAEVFQRHQIVRDFYDEIKYRQELEVHCQWYYATAKQHQQELQKMQGDLNIFSWFSRNRSRS